MVCFSFSTDGSGEKTGLEEGDSFTLYNGKWKLYPTVLTTTGENWETFILDLKSDSVAKKYVPHGFIDIYAYDPEKSEWAYFKPTTNQLFKPINKINVNDDRNVSGQITAGVEKVLYGATLENVVNREDGKFSNTTRASVQDNVFNLALNEDKQYVITFGDGTTGAKPASGSLLYIVYLQ
jgi:hypothetical protein